MYCVFFRFDTEGCGKSLTFVWHVPDVFVKNVLPVFVWSVFVISWLEHLVLARLGFFAADGFSSEPPRVQMWIWWLWWQSTLLGGKHWQLQYNSTLSGISPIISRWRRIDTPTDQTELRTWQRLTRKVISISASLHLDLPENDIKPIYHPVRNLLCTVHSTTRIWLLQPNSWLIAPLYCNVVFPKCKVREALCKNETV